MQSLLESQRWSIRRAFDKKSAFLQKSVMVRDFFRKADEDCDLTISFTKMLNNEMIVTYPGC